MPALLSVTWNNETIPSLPQPKRVNRRLFLLECGACGYEIQEGVIAPPCCPRCHGWSTFERSKIPGSILAQADEFPEGADPRIGFSRHVVISADSKLLTNYGKKITNHNYFKPKLVAHAKHRHFDTDN